jgi:chemotaxis protein MotB
MVKKKPEAEKENSERWTLTYLDMITLLFAFFVVLYAISNVDAAKYQALSASLSSVFSSTATVSSGTGAGEGRILTTKSQKKPNIPLQSKMARSRVYDLALNMLKIQADQGKVSIRQEERGLLIQLGADFFFKSGSAQLPEDSGLTFVNVARLLSEIPNEIQIEGYADDTSTNGNSGFQNNWELAAQRSINVLCLLQDIGIPPNRMRAVSYGDTKAAARNDSPEGRAFNRRVDILVLYSAEEINAPIKIK